jgi:hypothetical protein
MKFLKLEYRKIPFKLSLRKEIFTALGVLLLGILLGVIAKAADSVSVIGDIGTDLAVWVLLGTLIAAYSRRPASAAVNELLFFLGLLAGYYAYCQFVLGFFPQAYCLGWLIVAVIASPCAAVLWFARSPGLTGSLITALPAGLIFAWSYPAFYSGQIVLVLGIAYALLICALLPVGWKMKLAALAAAVPAAFIINTFHLTYLLPF